MISRKLFFILLVFVIGGCAQQSLVNKNNPQNTEVILPAKVSKIMELKNGDAYDLTASYAMKEIEGKSYKMLAYNGSIPGPTLKVAQGSEITVNLKNNTDIPTSLHSHGIRLEDTFDGAAGAQQPGQSFSYTIKFPDAGIYWYHPHFNEPYTQSRGLYGAYLVTPTDKNFWSPVNEEVPLMLSDISIQNGQMESFNPDVTQFALMGEFGNVMLVNGEVNYQKAFQTGEVVRFYIANAANTRVYNLSIPGAKMKLVGGDNGKYEHEIWQDQIILSPSERVVVEVLFEKAGVYELQNINPQKTYTLASFNVSEAQISQSFAKEFEVLRDNKDVITDIDAFRDDFDKKADKSLTISLDMRGMGNMAGMNHGAMMKMDSSSVAPSEIKGEIEWEDTMAMMNAMSTTDSVKWKLVDDETKKVNMDIDWKFKLGDKVKVKIFNDLDSMHPMQHPIHFHGQRFLVLSMNGIKNMNLVWKDTVHIPQGDTVEILVDMSNPGKWMAHCHIPEHLSSGMMLPFEVQ